MKIRYEKLSNLDMYFKVIADLIEVRFEKGKEIRITLKHLA
jgi:hypothetical protein